MNEVMAVLAIFSLTFLFKESNGPWGMMSYLRNYLFSNKYVGIFFYQLFDCYFCLGCHAGYLIYLLYHPISQWQLNHFILWFLAGGAISYLLSRVIDYFSVIK